MLVENGGSGNFLYKLVFADLSSETGLEDIDDDNPELFGLVLDGEFKLEEELEFGRIGLVFEVGFERFDIEVFCIFRCE